MSKRVADDVRRAVAWLNQTQDIRHQLPVVLVPNDTVGEPERGRYGFGVFVPDFDGKGPRIFVGAGLSRIYLKDGGTPAESRAAVVNVLFHEFGHYEQFRDGLPLIEKGVQPRANKLSRSFAARKK